MQCMYVVIYIVLLSWYFSLDFTLSIFAVDICVISTIVHAGKPVECILIIGILKEDMKGSSFRKIYTGGALSKRDAQKFYSALPVIYKSKYKEEKWCVKKRKKNEVWTCESFFRFSPPPPPISFPHYPLYFCKISTYDAAEFIHVKNKQKPSCFTRVEHLLKNYYYYYYDPSVDALPIHEKIYSCLWNSDVDSKISFFCERARY